MTTDDIPPGRTRNQQTLMTSSSAWGWWQSGYERGVESGYAAGYHDAIRVFDEAAAHLVATGDLSGSFEARQQRAKMLALGGEPEDLAARHAACARSWGLTEGAA